MKFYCSYVYKDADKVVNCVDPDQFAVWAVWSAPALFAQTYLSQFSDFYTVFVIIGLTLTLFYFQVLQSAPLLLATE